MPTEEAPKRKPTRQEIGRMRRMYFTKVHPTVVACGHKFNQEKQPTNNCESCWEAYFKTAVNLEELKVQLGAGIEELTKIRGSKFVKQLRRFFENQLASFQQERMNGVSEESGAAVEITGSAVVASQDSEGTGSTVSGFDCGAGQEKRDDELVAEDGRQEVPSAA